RARIMRKLLRFIHGADRIEIWLEQRFGFGAHLRLHDAADTAQPLPGLARFIGSQIVQTNACMGIDHPKRLFLALQIFHDARQHRMLDHIRKVARMIGVPVIHDPPSLPQRGGGAEFFFSSRFPERRKATTKPMKPTPIRESPAGSIRGSALPVSRRKTRSTALMSASTLSPIRRTNR